MSCFQNDCHAKRLEDAVKTAGNFSGHLFLNLKTFYLDIDETGELRNPNHTIAGRALRSRIEQNLDVVRPKAPDEIELNTKRDFLDQCEFREILGMIPAREETQVRPQSAYWRRNVSTPRWLPAHVLSHAAI